MFVPSHVHVVVMCVQCRDLFLVICEGMHVQLKINVSLSLSLSLTIPPIEDLEMIV